MGLSSLSTVSLEKVAQAGGPQGLRWFQLYVFKDREVTRRYSTVTDIEGGIGMERE
jgi:(S)-2-hydroxy-acid oxidase